MSRTIQALLMQALEAEGYEIDRDFIRKYGAKSIPMRKPDGGKRYFVGKAGSLRVSKGGKGQSHPSGRRDALIAAAQAMPDHHPKCAKRQLGLLTTYPCGCAGLRRASPAGAAVLTLEDLL
jgi:hypothetical protein